jgi:hypothetical protein
MTVQMNGVLPGDPLVPFLSYIAMADVIVENETQGALS